MQRNYSHRHFLPLDNQQNFEMSSKRNFRKTDNKEDSNQLESDENNPVVKQFLIYSAELLERHERHERLGIIVIYAKY